MSGRQRERRVRLDEVACRREPLADVHGASEDMCVEATEVVDVVDVPHLDGQTLLFELTTDRGGDLVSRTVLARCCDENPHVSSMPRARHAAIRTVPSIDSREVRIEARGSAQSEPGADDELGCLVRVTVPGDRRDEVATVEREKDDRRRRRHGGRAWDVAEQGDLTEAVTRPDLGDVLLRSSTPRAFHSRPRRSDRPRRLRAPLLPPPSARP